MPDIYDAIRADHDRHRALLDTLAETSGDSEERRAAWEEFYHDVKAHAAAEEETFYSKLITQTWGQEHARHSVHEHQQLDDIMEELNEMEMSSPGWLTRFKTLKDEYEHHMDEEENEVFERAQEVIPQAELKGHGEKFLARKEKEAGLIEKKKEDALEE
ncbi:hemerythrin domain-containing protein [Vannielia litorea]|uniref:Hemerythrin HHE cation binding domain-containing protein n=1 Tax=Vannielia litorea TaxID=1217970 RepID=A0A1N6GNP3_9RHOB|nr:hemerythrin domain-containing protein [Vannielia litorea]SIO09105.1 Hemerythrin HHE cation binding domain-containing protein [Vannielia litorea]